MGLSSITKAACCDSPSGRPGYVKPKLMLNKFGRGLTYEYRNHEKAERIETTDLRLWRISFKQHQGICWLKSCLRLDKADLPLLRMCMTR